MGLPILLLFVASSYFHFCSLLPRSSSFLFAFGFALFNLSVYNDLVVQWLSNVHLHCWPADSKRQKYSLSEGGGSNVLYALETSWIVASGSADILNEEINMFTFYSIHLWTERSAVMPCKITMSFAAPAQCLQLSEGGIHCAATPLGTELLWQQCPVRDDSPRALVAAQCL